MKPKIVPPTEVAKEISDALTRLARDVELRGTTDERRQASETRLADLLTMFTQHEAMALIRLIVEPRVKCARCGAGRPMRDCSAEHCLECAKAIAANRESEAH